GKAAFKWMVGNVDTGLDAAYSSSDNWNLAYAANSAAMTTALAYRGDWYMSDASYIGLSGLHGSMNRNFTIMAIDGGLTRGDWQLNGQVTAGQEARAAANGDEAKWAGISGFVGFKVVPRLQLMARADYIWNRSNGGGTYYYNGGSTSIGLGPKRTDSTGSTYDRRRHRLRHHGRQPGPPDLRHQLPNQFQYPVEDRVPSGSVRRLQLP
ncbi:MAG: DUF3138 family protein, partial [Betaproteobacteria bacterium]|nr:DUF3138 family protein [Betaproteobacteria bacterium]